MSAADRPAHVLVRRNFGPLIGNVEVEFWRDLVFSAHGFKCFRHLLLYFERMVWRRKPHVDIEIAVPGSSGSPPRPAALYRPDVDGRLHPLVGEPALVVGYPLLQRGYYSVHLLNDVRDCFSVSRVDQRPLEIDL